LASARRTKTRGAPPPPPRVRPRPAADAAPTPEGSAPELRFEYAPAGRETISAISEEVADAARELRARLPELSAPEISLEDAPAGRDTVTVIAREAAAHAATAVRPRLTTLDYSNRPVDGSPDASCTPSHATIDALARAMTEPEVAAGARHSPLEISELVTFVVRGGDLTQLSSEDGRRRFVTERLLARLPVRSLDQVLRVDVTPGTVRGTLIVRVWCQLDA
jgi:hypothetical protein